MKNMKVGLKIGFGFGALIVLTLLLGAMFWISMSSVGESIQRLDKEIIPQVASAVEFERDVQAAMYAMRGFAFTGQASLWDQTVQLMDSTKKAIAQALDQAGKYPSLAKMKESVIRAETKMGDYENLSKKNKELYASLNRVRSDMDQAAARFSKDTDDYFSYQRDALFKDIASAASQETVEARVKMMDWMEDVIVRRAKLQADNFKGQTLRDVKIVEDALASSLEISDLFFKLRPLTLDEESKKLLEGSQAMTQAAQAVTELAAQTLELKTLIEKMNNGTSKPSALAV